ncbi:MAG: lytic transglycosylase domain-containing protein [Clostridia bacterium]|nr:lytic transglycosylase domain-containing protein [Clostridia bacterium]
MAVRSGKKRAAVLAPLIAAAVIFACFGLLLVHVMNRKAGSYPRLYADEVAAASERYGLDADLVFAVIRTESSFKPDAVSSAGAKGLMQIMTPTAEWVCWRYNEEYDPSRIFEPEYNIELGCRLLAYLIDYYDGNTEYAVAAYNAGNGRVDGWLQDPERFRDGKLMIPIDETRNYVKKVLDSYEKYKQQTNN